MIRLTVSRGFVYVRDNEEMMCEARKIATDCINRCLENDSTDWMQLKSALRDELSRYFFKVTKRKPMILPVMMDI